MATLQVLEDVSSVPAKYPVCIRFPLDFCLHSHSGSLRRSSAECRGWFWPPVRLPEQYLPRSPYHSNRYIPSKLLTRKRAGKLTCPCLLVKLNKQRGNRFVLIDSFDCLCKYRSNWKLSNLCAVAVFRQRNGIEQNNLFECALSILSRAGPDSTP